MQDQLNPPPKPTSKAQLLQLTDPIYASQKLSKESEKVINQIKSRDRPSLKLEDWQTHHFFENNTIKDFFDCPDQIDRKHTHQLSVQEFRNVYLAQKRPVIIKGCTQQWKSAEFWSHQFFSQTFSNNLFKIGDDDDGQKLKTTMKVFLEYMVKNTDDSPLYLFQNVNNVHEQFSSILNNYKVPEYFQQNLLALLDLEQRPPFRWFLMGPQRSGSTVHVDPMMTSAWNTSLVGHKRWVLLNPNTPKYIVKGKEFRSSGYKDEAINYFVEILPKIKHKYSQADLQLVEFIQYPGQTVFIPSGIWHAVLNLDDTIAVTQNFISYSHFQEGWKAIHEERKYLIPLLLEKLKESNQQFYLKAVEIDHKKALSQLSDSEKDAVLQNCCEVDNFKSSTLKEQEVLDSEGEEETRPRVGSQSKKVSVQPWPKSYSDDGCSPRKIKK